MTSRAKKGRRSKANDSDDEVQEERWVVKTRAQRSANPDELPAAFKLGREPVPCQEACCHCGRAADELTGKKTLTLVKRMTSATLCLNARSPRAHHDIACFSHVVP